MRQPDQSLSDVCSAQYVLCVFPSSSSSLTYLPHTHRTTWPRNFRFWIWSIWIVCLPINIWWAPPHMTKHFQMHGLLNMTPNRMGLTWIHKNLGWIWKRWVAILIQQKPHQVKHQLHLKRYLQTSKPWTTGTSIHQSSSRKGIQHTHTETDKPHQQS